MSNLDDYRQRYRNIIHGTIKQKAGSPSWNKEIAYTYSAASEKVDYDIAGQAGTLQAVLTYPDDVEWYFCKLSGKYKQDVKEVHTFKLRFDNFDSSERYFKDYIDRRNLVGTYVKTVDITMRTRDSEDVVEDFTYTDVLSGVFKSYDFDYQSEQFTGTNQSIVGKNICFIDEEFVSTTDADADPNEHYNEPNYSLFFTYNFCQVYLFTDRTNINKYADNDRYNNRPTEDWTCVWLDAPEGSAIKDGVRAITGKRLSTDTAQLNIDDVRDVYCYDGDCTLYLKFEPNSNIGKGVCSNLTKCKTGNPDETEPDPKGLSDKKLYFVFKFADQSKTVNSIDDIDFDNLQDYIISLRVNKELTADCVELDFIPGFIFDGKYL